MRFTRLAETVPADKYKWRPAEGIRSIGEVYAHIVAANYGVARAFGTQLPAGVDFKAITATAGDKDQDVQGLKDSFAHFRKAILALGDADKAQKMFGRDTTQRGAFSAHTGEHLGQSIAYCAALDGRSRATTKSRQQAQAVTSGGVVSRATPRPHELQSMVVLDTRGFPTVP
jgi:DinB superfamily